MNRLFILYHSFIILFQIFQQMSVIHIVQIRIIGFIGFIKENIRSFHRFVKTLQVSIIIHCQAVERSMAGILLQSHVGYFKRLLEIMVQE